LVAAAEEFEWDEFMPPGRLLCLSRIGVPHQTTPAEEKSYLVDVARRLEEELLLVKERIEKLRSVA
jgi:hypothetical protein